MNETTTPTPAVLPELPAPELPATEKQEVTVEEFLKMRNWFVEQISVMRTSYDDIVAQIDDFKNNISKTGALTQRVERLAALMAHHMTYFRQLVELVDSYGDRIVANEKAINSMDLKYDTLVNRQHQFMTIAAEMRQNTKMIIDEIEKLHAKSDEHDRFKYKITAAFAIAGTVLGWLMMGDNLTKVANFIQSIWPGSAS